MLEKNGPTWKSQPSPSLCITHPAHQQRSSELEVCSVRQAGAHAGVQAVDVVDGLDSHLSSLCITRPRSAHSSLASVFYLSFFLCMLCARDTLTCCWDQ